MHLFSKIYFRGIIVCFLLRWYAVLPNTWDSKLGVLAYKANISKGVSGAPGNPLNIPLHVKYQNLELIEEVWKNS